MILPRDTFFVVEPEILQAIFRWLDAFSARAATPHQKDETIAKNSAEVVKYSADQDEAAEEREGTSGKGDPGR